MMPASFAASHPQVVLATLQLCIALARYTLLCDVQQTAYLSHYNWISLKKIAESSPSATTIGKWVRELARVQVIVSRHALSGKNVSVFFQTDGGHAGQEAT